MPSLYAEPFQAPIEEKLFKISIKFSKKYNHEIYVFCNDNLFGRLEDVDMHKNSLFVCKRKKHELELASKQDIEFLMKDERAWKRANYLHYYSTSNYSEYILFTFRNIETGEVIVK